MVIKMGIKADNGTWLLNRKRGEEGLSLLICRVVVTKKEENFFFFYFVPQRGRREGRWGVFSSSRMTIMLVIF